jgi:hypothetical protein
MMKTTEEKIDDIHVMMSQMHDELLTLKLQSVASQAACTTRHKTNDEALHNVEKDLYGNGQPGLLARFNSLETRLIAWSCAALMVMQILGPKISAALGL